MGGDEDGDGDGDGEGEGEDLIMPAHAVFGMFEKDFLLDVYLQRPAPTDAGNETTTLFSGDGSVM